MQSYISNIHSSTNFSILEAISHGGKGTIPTISNYCYYHLDFESSANPALVTKAFLKRQLPILHLF